MRDEHDRRFQLCPQGLDVVGQRPPGDLVQRREGLVEQQQLRPRHQRPGQGHPHGHAAGQLRLLGRLGAGVQTHLAQGFPRTLQRPRLRDPRQLQRQRDVGGGGGPGHQGGRLEHHRSLPAPLGQGHLAAARPLKARQQPQRRRLAATRRPDQRHRLARLQPKAEWPKRASAAWVVDLDVTQRGDSHFSSHAKRGRGTMRSMVEGASRCTDNEVISIQFDAPEPPLEFPGPPRPDP